MNYSLQSFPEVTLLVTHYNRSNSLRNLLKTFKSFNFCFGDMIVSDDGSEKKHLKELSLLQKEFSFRLITVDKNKGLGNNINKGQDCVKTPYTLYVQEDFEPSGEFAKHFKEAVEIMEERVDLDLVRFYSYLRYPYLVPYKAGYSEMKIPSLALDYNKIYCYSDHPHLRRSTFFEKFGRYAEGIKPDRTEYRMCLSFIRKKGKGLFFDNYKSLFYQKNTVLEPSTIKRSKWTESENGVLKIVRSAYRQVRYNYDILFAK